MTNQTKSTKCYATTCAKCGTKHKISWDRIEAIGSICDTCLASQNKKG